MALKSRGSGRVCRAGAPRVGAVDPTRGSENDDKIFCFPHESLSRSDAPIVCYHSVQNNHTRQQLLVVPGIKYYYANPVLDEAVQ